MELITYKLGDNLHLSEKIIAAIGQFDGLHLAHTTLIKKAISLAKTKNIKSAVITFDPHPDFVLGKRANYGYITPISAKINYLQSLGIDYLILIEFTKELSQLEPSEFEQKILLSLNIDTLVAGFDFHYGRFGKGNIDTLRDLNKFDVIEIPMIEYQNEKMGSDLVRKYLTLGELDHVKNILGRYYNITGKVVPGNKVGRILGFKTANVSLDDDYHFLRKGVYGVIVTINNKEYLGVANIGNNPTVNYVERPRLEVHILDFNDDIYGQEISVDFVFFIRDEEKFININDLIKQIEEDAKIAKEKLLMIKEKENESCDCCGDERRS
ncbi:MAG: riboflavin biosynthesis protein RibF [Acholeplasmataceae bacterium]|nr:riboflavin biosynthesis protein RibF [Acholeplasmataceae bacterium]HQA20220.1 riboflavin biosynthesis protein RibF [Bacilli bacterium]HQD92930.1 riboflavin biosynthesis protein RibF [Bacilli bacterium]